MTERGEVTGLDDFSALEPAPAGMVILGEGPAAVRVVVKPLKVGQLPTFARAVRPLADKISAALAGGINPGAIAALIEEDFEQVVQVLHAATGASVEAIHEATISQALELVLAVLQANRDFLRGRMVAALRTAATLNPGAGPTPSSA